MLKFFATVLVLTGLLSVSLALPAWPATHWKNHQKSGHALYKSSNEGRHRASLELNSKPKSADGPTEAYYTGQLLDHFDRLNTKTWSQRYFVNSTFFDANNRTGPIFLLIGGEGPALDSSAVVNSIHFQDAVELAQVVGALLVCVEHRYYGFSIPVPDFTTENLRWLSAHQALADLNQFQTWFTQLENLTNPYNFWFSWGGSYPGMLSGWYRLKFPHMVVGAVSSSSPVKAQLNFQGYDEVVGASLALTDIGGSPACLEAVMYGHAVVGQMITTSEGRNQLAKMFNICSADSLADPENQSDWAGNGVILVPAQENDLMCPDLTCNIGKICQIMTDTSKGSEIQRLALVAQQQNGGPNAPCTVVDHNQVLQSFLNTTLEGGQNRIWQYQTCTEFAFYQTCEIGSTCPYTMGFNTIDKALELCSIPYNISAQQVQDSVDYSNAYWGADRPQGNNILFPNGEVDPWHYLGVNVQVKESEPILYVRTASHHQWTHPSASTDTPALSAARQVIWDTVLTWLTIAKSEL